VAALTWEPEALPLPISGLNGPAVVGKLVSKDQSPRISALAVTRETAATAAVRTTKVFIWFIWVTFLKTAFGVT
jgi:hypothetical protein